MSMRSIISVVSNKICVNAAISRFTRFLREKKREVIQNKVIYKFIRTAYIQYRPKVCNSLKKSKDFSFLFGFYTIIT